MAPPRVLKDEGVLRWWRSASDHSADPRHRGAVDGAERVGEAAGGDGAAVKIGVWLDRMGRVRRACWTAADGDALVAYAEVACALLESGVAPTSVDAAALRRTVPGVPRDEEQLADLVATAIAAALCGRELPP